MGTNTNRTKPALLLLVACSATLGGCVNTLSAIGDAADKELTVAIADLKTASGADAGTATVREDDRTFVLTIMARGVSPGQHGVHVHMTGKCDGPAFTTAGGHWNPTGHSHGLQNPGGQHAGDMPNIVIAADGTGTLTYRLRNATLEGLLDADGSSMVIHAAADDQMTDPSGNSGDRIACGVFRAP